MVYECDQCAAPLPPGVRVCPKCGDAFDETVPADAEVPTRGFTAKPVPAPVSIISPPIVSTLPTLKSPQIGPLRQVQGQDGFQEFTGPELVARGKTENKSGKGLFRTLFLIGAVAFVAWMIHLGDTAPPSPSSSSAVSAPAPVAPTPSPPAQPHLTAAQTASQKRHEQREQRRLKQEAARQKRMEEGLARQEVEAEAEKQTEIARVQAADDSAYAGIRAMVEHDHPNDYSTQKFVYDENVEAYKYMKTVPDGAVKQNVEHDHPYDYSTQKFVYEEQMKAKQEMGAAWRSE